jgi:hypothetical protein
VFRCRFLYVNSCKLWEDGLWTRISPRKSRATSSTSRTPDDIDTHQKHWVWEAQTAAERLDSDLSGRSGPASGGGCRLSRRAPGCSRCYCGWRTDSAPRPPESGPDLKMRSTNAMQTSACECRSGDYNCLCTLEEHRKLGCCVLDPFRGAVFKSRKPKSGPAALKLNIQPTNSLRCRSVWHTAGPPTRRPRATSVAPTHFTHRSLLVFRDDHADRHRPF